MQTSPLLFRAVFLLLAAFALVPAGRAAAWEVTITESTSCLNVFEDLDVENLLDGDTATCWGECAEGPGEGEFVAFAFDAPVILDKLGVANGCQSGDSYEAYNRVAELEVLYSNGARERFDLADAKGVQMLPLTPMTTTSLTVTITKVIPADSLFDRGRTCLSEIQFVGRYQDASGPATGQAPVVVEEAAPESDEESVTEPAPEPAEESVEEAAEEPVEESVEEPEPPATPEADKVEDPATAPLAPQTDGSLALPVAEPPSVFTASASSVLSADLGGMAFSADNLVDGSKRTAWVEGASGSGVGEWAEIVLPNHKPLAGIWIANGCQAGEHTFEANNRPKILELSMSSGDSRTIRVEDKPGLQYVDLGGAMTERLRLTIRDVYPGGDGEHTCLAEVRPAYVGASKAVADMDDEQLGTPEERAVAVVRAFYTRLITLDDGYADLYADALRDDEELIYEVFRETQKQRGMFQLFRNALVDLDDLTMRSDQVAEDEVKVVVDGFYTVYVGQAFERIDENTVFTLILEDGRWKILDKQEL